MAMFVPPFTHVSAQMSLYHSISLKVARFVPPLYLLYLAYFFLTTDLTYNVTVSLIPLIISPMRAGTYTLTGPDP